MVLRISVPSSMKMAWPRVLKTCERTSSPSAPSGGGDGRRARTTFQVTRSWFTPWMAIARLLAEWTVQFMTYDLSTMPT